MVRISEPGDRELQVTIWRRHVLARLFFAVGTLGMSAGFTSSTFLLVEDAQSDSIGLREVVGVFALLAFALACLACVRTRLALGPKFLKVRNIREVAIPLEDIVRIEFLHWGMAVHVKNGKHYRSLAVDRIDFPCVWRGQSRGSRARRVILRAAALRRAEIEAVGTE
ncbi:hypothetical protein ACWGSE_04790 [Streptomyces diastaticus]|uniref:hypothetical protein n=1 Tax=Streptomyces diastaticus TaxID=1956 RepID=UPI0035DBA4F9